MDENKDMEIRDISRIFEETVKAEKCAAESNADPSLRRCGESACDCGKTCASDIAYPALDGIGEDPAALKLRGQRRRADRRASIHIPTYFVRSRGL